MSLSVLNRLSVSALGCLVVLLLSIAGGYAQRNLMPGWEDPRYRQADTGANEPELSQAEKDVIFYTNLWRMNPRLYFDTYIQRFIQSTGLDPKSKYVTTLKAEAAKQKPLGILKPAACLYATATRHAKDMGSAGKIGHTTSKGENVLGLIRKSCKNGELFVGQNCSYGITDPADIVSDLLVDEGIPNFGHRRNFQSEVFTHIGVGIQPHKTYRTNVVIDFAQLP
jgi:uncharacterized protein YkwD